MPTTLEHTRRLQANIVVGSLTKNAIFQTNLSFPATYIASSGTVEAVCRPPRFAPRCMRSFYLQYVMGIESVGCRGLVAWHISCYHSMGSDLTPTRGPAGATVASTEGKGEGTCER